MCGCPTIEERSSMNIVPNIIDQTLDFGISGQLLLQNQDIFIVGNTRPLHFYGNWKVVNYLLKSNTIK